jgi:hypothetical protein
MNKFAGYSFKEIKKDNNIVEVVKEKKNIIVSFNDC